jgi:hypothetical protein
MSNVEKFYPADAAKDPDNVLEQAVGEYSELLVIGWDKEGNLDARATMDLKDGDALLLLELFKLNLLSGEYSECPE